jgi:hypothetical protein
MAGHGTPWQAMIADRAFLIAYNRRVTPKGSPLFTIEHDLEIPATRAQVWAVLVDFASYADWNPYVLSIDGELASGSLLEVTIAQDNWREPLTIKPTLVQADANRLLHWRSSVGDGSVLDTDHSFHLDALSAERVRFTQREEFRGTLAPQLEADARKFTHKAFCDMDEALCERAMSLEPERST